MITGGVDCNVVPATYRYMYRIKALRLDSNEAPEKAVCPFDKSRNGTALGDGGAFFLMESLESAIKRKAHIYCELLSYNANCIGNHIASADLKGECHFINARKALVDAGITPS